MLPDGLSLPPATRVIGRGSRLHFLTDTSWYQLDMAISLDDLAPKPAAGGRLYLRV